MENLGHQSEGWNQKDYAMKRQNKQVSEMKCGAKNLAWEIKTGCE